MNFSSSQNIDDTEFTVFDTETTGLEPQSGDRIVEIAGIRFKGNEQIAVFQTLVNPKRPISEAAAAVNHITLDMLKDAPAIDRVMPDFLDFIKGSCICSYNATFDLEFLSHELKLMGRELPADLIAVDILKMAKRLLPGLERYALWFVAERLGIKDPQQHRALSDVELTLEAFYRLKNILRTKGISDYPNFLGLFAINSHFVDNLHNQKIAQIQEAINLGVRLKIKYLSRSSAEVTERQVLPWEIRQEKNNSYLIGHCCLKNEERTFRIDGILHLEIL
jgi:DNA polymerase-3 subunit alpha (Gram-positive type)